MQNRSIFTCGLYEIKHWPYCQNTDHFMQCYEEVRKVLEMCDITEDINGFINTKSTGTTRAGQCISRSFPLGFYIQLYLSIITNQHHD